MSPCGEVLEWLGCGRVGNTLRRLVGNRGVHGGCAWAGGVSLSARRTVHRKLSGCRPQAPSPFLGWHVDMVLLVFGGSRSSARASIPSVHSSSIWRGTPKNTRQRPIPSCRAIGNPGCTSLMKPGRQHHFETHRFGSAPAGSTQAWECRTRIGLDRRRRRRRRRGPRVPERSSSWRRHSRIFESQPQCEPKVRRCGGAPPGKAALQLRSPLCQWWSFAQSQCQPSENRWVARRGPAWHQIRACNWRGWLAVRKLSVRAEIPR